MDTKPFLEAAKTAARAAAEIINRYYRTQIAVERKADNSPVTRADVESEKAIRQVLESRFPDHGFYGEETGRSDRSSDFLWLVDPIDGTKSFVRNYPFFSTQIALMYQDQIIVGVSSAPVFDELAWAAAGSGAWLNGRQIQVSDIRTIGEASISTGNLATLAGGKRWSRWGQIVATADRIRGYGDFYHYHLLADGCIDAVVESDVNILDVAALSLIVEEAGGRFTNLEGKPVTLGITSVLATNRALHSPILEALG
ncbi:MAG: inositol monophosphatase family protein [Gammaproteobacteria bacterium]|nr:MAG: inositol-phosphate phosphatase [Gammaproteobacteria bacterium SG8_31]